MLLIKYLIKMFKFDNKELMVALLVDKGWNAKKRAKVLKENRRKVLIVDLNILVSIKMSTALHIDSQKYSSTSQTYRPLQIIYI